MATKKKFRAPANKAGGPLAIPMPRGDEQTMLALVAKAATDPAFDAEKFKILMDARAKDREEQAKIVFGAAMAEVQQKIEPVRRDCANTQTRSRYASYEALDRAIRPIYTAAGFALSFSTAAPDEPGTLLMTCRLRHRAGYTEFYQLPIPIVTKGPQGKDVMTATHAAMSAKTYGMRGLLMMMFNITTTDDDGNAAGSPQITAEQAEALKKLLKGPPAFNEQTFCTYMEIDDIASMPASRYAEAVAEIDAKRKAMQQ